VSDFSVDRSTAASDVEYFGRDLMNPAFPVLDVSSRLVVLWSGVGTRLRFRFLFLPDFSVFLRSPPLDDPGPGVIPPNNLVTLGRVFLMHAF